MSVSQDEKVHDDGGFIRSYKVSSWFVLRLYGLAFSGLAYLAYQWELEGHEKLPDLLLGLPTEIGLWAFAFTGGCLLLPFLTPSFLAHPKSLMQGLLKACLLGAISYWLYLVLPAVLTGGVVPQGHKFLDILPLFFKCFAGMAISGAILVGFVAEMTAAPKGKHSHLSKRAQARLSKQKQSKQMPVMMIGQEKWSLEAALHSDKSSCTKEELRQMRHQRMQS